ncbi:SDR family oxidoreductase [Nocardia cyriacigeorgica]|jgi:NAD(P)-dependent dehydrogenase (short-subunit alcohol dehydrogenase family)|uniref:SDR family oxidoreductase n=1 Tax=Nocardia cyriacigeorgica TaxID=135487 RepID=UPI0018956AC0|nr:SDR family oxidoreductase [Nocardia cyriacigeorgica]MBF6086350.1 SDR family oxidoreductase [Nocardia cyriacigeorgica]MBF6091337.1 SDR family oxidoreductase [Nocardia cyriacigeorgica]MBF6097640.1 SDR family oxidoreductase [Nocardia cyriacigeorgica]MBF6161287.1 SDR family oxidoreductase [Nocardia cyriacigeorgica]MBF6200288.1 SDR family oxidoreductase [Nocardia cyriacigeorgica]
MGRVRARRRTTVEGAKTLITGAASGIGRATALAAAARGAELVLTDIDAPGLAATVADIQRDGGKVLVATPLDITDHEAVAAFGADVHSRFGSVDVVMNVAGTSVWGTVDTLEHRHWQRMVDVNLMGPIHVIETFVPEMVRAGRGGALVNVSSAAGLLALPWHAAYSASKYGLRGLSEVLRFELAQHGISVHLVAPGAVNTPLVQSFELVGVDKEDPRVGKLVTRFTRHAVAPEKVAAAILRGIERNRFIVYTSFDIRFGYWWKRKFAFPYELLMRVANVQFSRLRSSLRTSDSR